MSVGPAGRQRRARGRGAAGKRRSGAGVEPAERQGCGNASVSIKAEPCRLRSGLEAAGMPGLAPLVLLAGVERRGELPE